MRAANDVKRKVWRGKLVGAACLALTATVAVAALLLSQVGPARVAEGAAAKAKVSTPSLRTPCDPNSTDLSLTAGTIELEVCAGTTGAPAGFSVQWMTCEDFTNGTACNAPGAWPTNSDALECVGVLCKASFSGNASGTRYNLAAGECAKVTIGAILLDNGASTNCSVDLGCDNCYVFRAFAHATNKLNRSDYTGTKSCTTVACPVECSSYSNGYWKTHYPEAWPAILQDDGMTAGLTIGCVDYTPQQLEDIFNTNPMGGPGTTCLDNKFISLMHQLIAARLSIEAFPTGSFANDPLVQAAIAAAELELCNGEFCDPNHYNTALDDLIHVVGYHCGL